MDQMSSPPPAAPPMMASTPPAMPVERPTGVTVLAVLYFVGAVFALLGGIMMLTVGSMFTGMMDSGLFALMGAALGGMFVVIAALLGVAGWGLWSRQRWAWYLVMVLEVLSLISGLFSLPSGIVGMAIAGLIIWYFTTPPVQAWFGVAYKVPWNKQATA